MEKTKINQLSILILIKLSTKANKLRIIVSINAIGMLAIKTPINTLYNFSPETTIWIKVLVLFSLTIERPTPIIIDREKL